MWTTIFEALMGFSFGLVIASAVVAFIISLGIIPRYAGITKTASHVMLYEDCSMAGAILGSLFTLARMKIPVGAAGLVIYGTFSGIFLGGWILALGEVVNIYPIMTRRIGLKHGIKWVVIAVALGKLSGSLLYFYKGWWQ